MRFCVSAQHYTFAANAFVELVQRFGQERYEFILNETQTHQVIEDVRNRFCDLGMRIGYLLNKDRELSELGRIYVEALLQYRPE